MNRTKTLWLTQAKRRVRQREEGRQSLLRDTLKLTGVGALGALSAIGTAEEYEDTRALMGEDYWRYGIRENKKELEAVVRYAHGQGLVSKPIDYLDMFHPATIE